MIVMHVFLISFLSHCTALDTSPSLGHDFHYSRIELNWNASTSTWQATTRVFTDDIEEAIQLENLNASDLRTKSRNSVQETLNFGDSLEHAQVDSWIATYLSGHCLGFAGQSPELPIEWEFIGKEVDFDLTYLYFESQPMPPHTSLTLTATLFFELFEDQVNEVTFQAADSELREWLTPEAPRTTFQWQP